MVILVAMRTEILISDVIYDGNDTTSFIFKQACQYQVPEVKKLSAEINKIAGKRNSTIVNNNSI